MPPPASHWNDSEAKYPQARKAQLVGDDTETKETVNLTEMTQCLDTEQTLPYIGPV